jgi:hypothetical protein
LDDLPTRENKFTDADESCQPQRSIALAISALRAARKKIVLARHYASDAQWKLKAKTLSLARAPDSIFDLRELPGSAFAKGWISR